MGVRFVSPSGDTVEGRTHQQCEDEIRDHGGDPADWTIELTPITGEINHWPGVAASRHRVFCQWA